MLTSHLTLTATHRLQSRARALADAVKASVRAGAAAAGWQILRTPPTAAARVPGQAAPAALVGAAAAAGPAPLPGVHTWTHCAMAAQAVRRVEAGARGLVLRVRQGEVWLTRSVDAPAPEAGPVLADDERGLATPDLAARDSNDHWLRAGQALALPPHSHWLLQAWSAAELTLQAAGPAAAAQADARSPHPRGGAAAGLQPLGRAGNGATLCGVGLDCT